MSQVRIHNHFDKAHTLFNKNIKNEELDNAFRSALSNTIANAISIAHELSGYKTLEIRVIEDKEATFNGAYCLYNNVDVTHIKFNTAYILMDSFGKLVEGYSPAFLEMYAFSRSLIVLLHELGHHHETQTIPTFWIDVVNLENGDHALSHLKSLSSVDMEEILKDKEFLTILSDSKEYVVESEKFADKYAADTLRNNGYEEVLTFLDTQNELTKSGYYYRQYSDTFLERISDYIFEYYFPSQKSQFEYFLEKVTLFTDNIILSRIRAARQKDRVRA